MLDRSPISTLAYALAPGIISCVAGVWTSNNRYCLPVHVGAGVIRNSGCRVLVIHQPNSNTFGILQDDALELDELIQELELPIDNLVLFFNTSLCSTMDDVQQAIEMMNFMCSLPPYSQVVGAFLKLEILDDNLRPIDSKIIKILNELPLEMRKVCIPFLSGELSALQHAVDLGCPAIRIWCSDIGQGKGIIDKQRLEQIVNLVNIPLILEGGLATPTDVQEALLAGFSAVLINSAFRHSQDPIQLATQIRTAIDQIRR